MSVQVPAPAGERWIVTDAIAPVVVALTLTVARKGVPGSTIETVEKLAAVAKSFPGFALPAVNVAPDAPKPTAARAVAVRRAATRRDLICRLPARPPSAPRAEGRRTPRSRRAAQEGR